MKEDRDDGIKRERDRCMQLIARARETLAGGRTSRCGRRG